MLRLVPNAHEGGVLAHRGAPPATPYYSARGTYVGPLLVVQGPEALLFALSEQLYDQPGLRRMRGALVLCRDHDNASEQADAMLQLDCLANDARRAYFQVLGRMTALGMIDGRGVPDRWVA